MAKRRKRPTKNLVLDAHQVAWMKATAERLSISESAVARQAIQRQIDAEQQQTPRLAS